MLVGLDPGQPLPNPNRVRLEESGFPEENPWLLLKKREWMLSRQVPDFLPDYVSRDSACLLAVPRAATSCSVPHGSLLVSELSLEPGAPGSQPRGPQVPSPQLLQVWATGDCSAPLGRATWASHLGSKSLSVSQSEDPFPAGPATQFVRDLSRPFPFPSLRFISWDVCKTELVVLLASQVCGRLR